jgi:hypothetical protein
MEVRNSGRVLGTSQMRLSRVFDVFARCVDVLMVCSAVSRTLALGPLLLLLLASSCCRCLYNNQLQPLSFLLSRLRIGRTILSVVCGC